MSDATSPQMLFDAVSERLRAELARQSEKAAMREVALSRATVSRARAGRAPGQSGKLLFTLKRLGTEAALRILEPVLGPLDDASLAARLDDLLAEVGDLRHAVKATSLAERPHGLLGWAGAVREAKSVAAAGEGGQAVSRLALVTARKPLDEIAGSDRENLRRQLADWEARKGRSEVEQAIGYAKADPLKQTGVAIRRPGSPWILPHVAERHPFRDLPLNQNSMAEDFDRTAADEQPWLLDTGAAFLARSGVATTANWVLRTIDRARDGTLILTAGFAPKVAA